MTQSRINTSWLSVGCQLGSHTILDTHTSAFPVSYFPLVFEISNVAIPPFSVFSSEMLESDVLTTKPRRISFFQSLLDILAQAPFAAFRGLRGV
jgi:hypothetical protein